MLHVSSHWCSSHRMLLLWERCSPSAFDSLHVCASRARDVECLWINWWDLLYSEYHFFFLYSFFFTPQFLRNTVSLGVCWRAAHSWPTMLEAVFLTQSSTDEVSEQIMQQHLENKQFHSDVQFGDKGVKFRARFSEQCLGRNATFFTLEPNKTGQVQRLKRQQSPGAFCSWNVAARHLNVQRYHNWLS